MKVHVKDHGFTKHKERIKHSGGSVKIGILEGAGDHDMVTVLDVAIWQEFGTMTIRPRSFLRAWFDENKVKAREMWNNLIKSVVAGKRTREEAMELFGLWAVGGIQRRISDNIPPPLAKSTVRRKGSSVALIDTGLLRSSITSKVVT